VKNLNTVKGFYWGRQLSGESAPIDTLEGGERGDPGISKLARQIRKEDMNKSAKTLVN